MRVWALGAALLGALAFAPAWAVTVGEAAPDFQLPATREAQGGSTVARLADLRGQLVYLDFWASWCGPCKQSFPWMNALQQRYRSRGLQVLAINLDTQTDEARQFLAKWPARFRVAFDREGDTPRRYAIQGMPSSVLIGPDGQVLAVHVGFRPDETAAIERAIEQALARFTPSSR